MPINHPIFKEMLATPDDWARWQRYKSNRDLAIEEEESTNTTDQ